jgi:hypothetical protein
VCPFELFPAFLKALLCLNDDGVRITDVFDSHKTGFSDLATKAVARAAVIHSNEIVEKFQVSTIEIIDRCCNLVFIHRNLSASP